jgi:hypothetical protein
MRDKEVAMLSNLASQFPGAWRLISYSATGPDGTTVHPFGPAAQGRLIYEAGGRMAVQLGRPDPTAAEMRNALDRYVAYYGTYTVDVAQGIVSHHLEASLNPAWAGGDQVRYFKIDGDRLTLSTPPMPIAGAERVGTLVWERLA